MTEKQNKLIITLVSLYIIKKQRIKCGLFCRSPSQQIGIIQSLLDNIKVTLMDWLLECWWKKYKKDFKCFFVRESQSVHKWRKRHLNAFLKQTWKNHVSPWQLKRRWPVLSSQLSPGHLLIQWKFETLSSYSSCQALCCFMHLADRKTLHRNHRILSQWRLLRWPSPAAPRQGELQQVAKDHAYLVLNIYFHEWKLNILSEQLVPVFWPPSQKITEENSNVCLSFLSCLWAVLRKACLPSSCCLHLISYLLGWIFLKHGSDPWMPTSNSVPFLPMTVLQADLWRGQSSFFWNQGCGPAFHPAPSLRTLNSVISRSLPPRLTPPSHSQSVLLPCF